MTKFYNRKFAKRVRHKWLKGLDLESMDAAEISGKLGTQYTFKSYHQYWFPEWDICQSPWLDDKGEEMKFDIIFADQVWEHLDYPWRATKNVFDMLRPKGIFYVCVPFYLKYHGAPHDCTRWTARGLHFLLEDCGFTRKKSPRVNGATGNVHWPTWAADGAYSMVRKTRWKTTLIFPWSHGPGHRKHKLGCGFSNRSFNNS